MSLIARIQFVNFLTYSNPGSRDRKPALRVVEFWPLKYSAAINIPNGHGKTNMITVLLYLLSRDSKLKELALALFTPRRCGAPTHIRVQLWDIPDELAQRDLTLEEGLMDPKHLPNNNDHYVFGLCAYQGEEPRFYYYRGTLEDCEVFERTDNSYIYHPESVVQQGVKRIGGSWNISSVYEWRSLVTNHIPSRVLAQQVKFHLAGGGDKSAPLQHVEQEDDESFDQAFFRTVIAPELLASTGEFDSDPDDPRENFEDELYAHFSKMASASVQAERERQSIESQESVVESLGGLVAAGERAQQGLTEYRELVAQVARDGAVIRHVVHTDPFPGLIDARHPPVGKANDLLPYLVVDKVHDVGVVDLGLATLLNVETREINQTAFRRKLPSFEIDNLQVIDFTCDLKISRASGWGGTRVPAKGYDLETALKLVELLCTDASVITTFKDVLWQAFAWMESTGDSNTYRKEVRKLGGEIRDLQETCRKLDEDITKLEGEARELDEQITKYDQAKGAYADLVKSGVFTEQELAAPSLLTEQVAHEMQAAIGRLNAHEKRVGNLEQLYNDHEQFTKAYPDTTARSRLASLSAGKQAAAQACQEAERRAQQSKENADLSASRVSTQEQQFQIDQQQFGILHDLQSHQATYRAWFGDAAPHSIDIAAGLEKITADERDLAQRLQASRAIRDELATVLPAVSQFGELFPGLDADSLDIPGELAKIAMQEQALAKRHAVADALHGRLLRLQPFVATFRSVFGDADPASLDPARERADLQNAITLAETAIGTLEQQVGTLQDFRSRYPDVEPSAWLASMESRRSALTREVVACQQQVETAARQLEELQSDPIARPQDVAYAHTLIDDSVPYVLLHAFIEEHCPAAVKQHWLTHFSALLFSPVVDTLEQAATAARLLYDGQATMPVMLADRLRDAMNSDAPALALDSECAYTWLAGIKTRMVHCLLNPAAIDEERMLASKRLDKLQRQLDKQQLALDELSEQSETVRLARGAAQADASHAEAKLAIQQSELSALHKRLPDVLRRSNPDALDSIAKAREDQALRQEHGADVLDRVTTELDKIAEEAHQLQASRSWYEARNSDEVRNVITAMRRYVALLRAHGDDVQMRIDEELRRMEAEEEALLRRRAWHEERNSDDARLAVSAMRRYCEAGGDTEVERLQRAVQDGIATLESIRAQWRDAAEAALQHEAQLASARINAQTAATAYDQSERHLTQLAKFAESNDLPFMQSHAQQRITLETERHRAEMRISYKSQFEHAQRYVKTKDDRGSEQELLNRKAAAEAKAASAKEQRTLAARTMDDKRVRQVSLEKFRDVLHETACRLLVEFRAVFRIMDDIDPALRDDAPRFENTDLYQGVEAIRGLIERAQDEPFLLEEIRKIGRLATDLELAGQAKDIARVKRDSDRQAAQFADSKQQFCRDILDGKRKGLSALSAEWLRDDARFEAPTILRSQIEAEIANKRKVLDQATASLDDIREKTTKVLTMLAQDAQRALNILEETMTTTPVARFYVTAEVVSADSVHALLDRLYGVIESRRRAHVDAAMASQKRHKKNDLEYLRSEIYRALFSNVKVEFRHPSIWGGDQSAVTSKCLSEGMRTAISLMWVAKLAEFRLRQAIDQAGGTRRQSRAALRKERYFVILDGLFSSLSHDELIDSAMESLRMSAGHFQLIGMIHHPRYINNARIFPAYFVGRPFRATSGKHAWLTVDKDKNMPASLGVFSSHYTQ
ncbi:MAG TPA: hypothetical protein VEC35_20920 [Noviherbaspirillum sp.]|nr:hypothetical protein [Noviherbaspirillum sp.]